MNSNNRDFYLKSLVGVILIVGAMYFQSTSGDVPLWILTGVGGFLTYVLGLSTRPPQ